MGWHLIQKCDSQTAPEHLMNQSNVSRWFHVITIRKKRSVSMPRLLVRNRLTRTIFVSTASVWCLLLLHGGAFSQSQAPPRFEVASVKPAEPDGRSGIGLYTYPGGRIRADNYTLLQLVLNAFAVQRFQVSGGPRWIDEDRFNIEAKPPASSESSKANPYSFKAPPNEEQRQMLQSLLADRFQLRWRVEKRDGPVYILKRGKNALKLQDSKNKSAYHWAGSNAGGAPNGDGLAGVNISMPEFTERLSGWLGRPVLDQTGLTGSYDFKYKFSDDSPDQRPDRVFVLTVSVQAIGLKLESARGPVETIVIGSAEKPSAN
jgi:uncharacterized protein (TIGR03435 family)